MVHAVLWRLNSTGHADQLIGEEGEKEKADNRLKAIDYMRKRKWSLLLWDVV